MKRKNQKLKDKITKNEKNACAKEQEFARKKNEEIKHAKN